MQHVPLSWILHSVVAMNRMEGYELRGINHIPMPEISGVAVVGTLEVHEFEISATKSHTVNFSSAQETTLVHNLNHRLDKMGDVHLDKHSTPVHTQVQTDTSLWENSTFTESMIGLAKFSFPLLSFVYLYLCRKQRKRIFKNWLSFHLWKGLLILDHNLTSQNKSVVFVLKAGWLAGLMQDILFYFNK